MAKYNCPITKQRIILKPKKLRLPRSKDILEEENFSDVIYDSDGEPKKPSNKK